MYTQYTKRRIKTWNPYIVCDLSKEQQSLPMHGKYIAMSFNLLLNIMRYDWSKVEKKKKIHTQTNWCLGHKTMTMTTTVA